MPLLISIYSMTGQLKATVDFFIYSMMGQLICKYVHFWVDGCLMDNHTISPIFISFQTSIFYNNFLT